MTETAAGIDPHGTCENSKLIALLDVLSRHEEIGESAFTVFRDIVSTGILGKDSRPKLSDEERQARADAADEKARRYSAARHFLETNPPVAYDKGDRNTYKSVIEIAEMMRVPRVERPRIQGILRVVLDGGSTDWGRVLERDGKVYYGARPRLLQYAA